jgi:hypothetical protein
MRRPICGHVFIVSGCGEAKPGCEIVADDVFHTMEEVIQNISFLCCVFMPLHQKPPAAKLEELHQLCLKVNYHSVQSSTTNLWKIMKFFAISKGIPFENQ